VWQPDGLENWRVGAHILRMVRWLKIALIVSGIVAGWLTLNVLTFDDSAIDFWPDK
jgi:hypothetical protein